MIEIKISSPTKILIRNSDRKGDRKIRLLTFAVVDESLSAFSQRTNVIPISKKPIYATPAIPSEGIIFISEYIIVVIKI